MPALDPIAVELLALLQRGGAFGHYWTNTRKSAWWPTDAPGQIPSIWKNVYFGVHPCTQIPPVNAKGEPKPPVSVRSQIRFIAAINCLFSEWDSKDFDGDKDTCLAHVTSLETPPSVIIDSGGGYHGYWLLTEPWVLNNDEERTQAGKLQAAWVRLVDGDDGAKDLARVLRLPGTLNFKYEIAPTDEQEYVPPREVSVVSANFDLLYELDDLATLAAPFIESDRPSAPAPTTTTSSTKRMDAYVLNALMAEVRLVQEAPDGDKHRQLLASASTLGELIAGKVLDQTLTFTLLADAIRGRAKDMKKAEQTILDGFSYGAARPRGVPVAPPPPAESYLPPVKKAKLVAPAPPPTPEPEIEELTEVETEISETLKLKMPKTYLWTGEVMKKIKPDGSSYTVYNGRLSPDAIGTDISTGEQTLTVSWNGKGDHGTLTAPRKVLSTGTGFLERLSALGANVHAGNAAWGATMLIETVAENADVLPRELVCERYGYVDTPEWEHLFICPAGTVGSPLAVRYTGRSPSKCGDNPELFPAAIRDIMTWNDAPVTLLLLAMSLASPMISRMRPTRNPTLYLAGTSNIGKTSLIHFILSAWGNPLKRPFLVQTVGLTAAGAYTALRNQSGLPTAFDEAHMSADGFVEKIAYNFANGETRTMGSLDGKGQGGEELFGVLFLVGEANTEFRNAGANNRRLGIDGNKTPPLGKGSVGEPGSAAYALGAARIKLFAKVVERGAGLFGPALARVVWERWDEFVAEVRRHETAECLAELGPWARSLAICFAALNWACELAGAEAPPPETLDAWVAILREGRAQLDPAVETFEDVLALFQAATENSEKRHEHPGWDVRFFNHEPVAYRKDGEEYWRMPTRSGPWQERVKKSTVQLHGTTWARRGWVIEVRGEVSAIQGISKGQARCVCIHQRTPMTWNKDTAELEVLEEE
jgi:hypothetical protein